MARLGEYEPDDDAPDFYDGEELHPDGPSREELAAADADDDEEDTYPCPECGRELYESAEKCPGCGNWTRAGEERRATGWWAGIAALVMTIGLALVRLLRRTR